VWCVSVRVVLVCLRGVSVSECVVCVWCVSVCVVCLCVVCLRVWCVSVSECVISCNNNGLHLQ